MRNWGRSNIEILTFSKTRNRYSSRTGVFDPWACSKRRQRYLAGKTEKTDCGLVRETSIGVCLDGRDCGFLGDIETPFGKRFPLLNLFPISYVPQFGKERAQYLELLGLPAWKLHKTRKQGFRTSLWEKQKKSRI